MIAAVTGATGTVGRFIVDRLLAEGIAVRAWRRAGSDLTGLPAAIEWMDGDLASPEAGGELVEGADLLVHAALSHAAGRYRGGEGNDLPGFIRDNVSGSLALLALAREAGVGRCVVLSSRAVFGAAAAPAPIPDSAPVRPDTHYGAAKAALEAFVASWGLGDGWTIAALRPTGVYGVVRPVGRSKWAGLVAAALRGEAVAARAGTEVHGRDVADAVWRLATADAAMVAGRAFNCSDLVVSTRDVVAIVQEVAGVAGPLPDRAADPPNIMDCAGLTGLGIRFGGRPLLEASVAELAAALKPP